jgi:hypothetical protein
MPTFIASSAVIGHWLVRPRMPSVPKYFRPLKIASRWFVSAHGHSEKHSPRKALRLAARAA